MSLLLLLSLVGMASSLSFGVIGCGTIASSIVTGLATCLQDEKGGAGGGGNSVTSTTGGVQGLGASSPSMPLPGHFYVSSRSVSKSSALLERFGPDVVTVSSDNQEIADKSSVLFLCVLPSQVPEVLEGLNLSEEKHTLISLVSTSKLEQLVRLSKLPRSRVFKMMCLPSVATRSGCCLITPRSPPLEGLFTSLGGCVGCETEEVMTKLSIPSCLMGPYYAMLKNTTDWLVSQGVPEKDASYYVGKTYLGIAKDAEAHCDRPGHFDDLIAEQTPGGVNQQSISNMHKLGVFKAYDKVMDAILERLSGGGSGDL